MAGNMDYLMEAVAAYREHPRFLAMRLANLFKPVGQGEGTSSVDLHNALIAEVRLMAGIRIGEWLLEIAERLIIQAEKECNDHVAEEAGKHAVYNPRAGRGSADSASGV